MIVKSCKFVEASQIFKDFPLAWDLFVNSDPSCTWGDNNRSMVTPDVISDALQNADADDKQAKQVEAVVAKLASIEVNTYVDLEN
jgi:hypothetical protein